MYVIVAQENHPDRFIVDLIGPFDDADEAWECAGKLEDRDSNIIPGWGKRNHYSIKYVESPENA